MHLLVDSGGSLARADDVRRATTRQGRGRREAKRQTGNDSYKVNLSRKTVMLTSPPPPTFGSTSVPAIDISTPHLYDKCHRAASGKTRYG